MRPDGICRVTETHFTKTIQFRDINYQLSSNEDKQHKKGFAIALGILLMLAFMLNAMSSCGVLVEGVVSGVSAGTYPASDEE